ncbi:ImmA/IrrE family metallo-endopeptidase [Mycobacteroides abscessus]|uniref:ImmA/IrrE family metallo-endopeptidase n=1 Tax=Mycobacteroides abscessus TaxID=36809 RepID=UPI000D6ACB93|nr:ImmA/IrrE family metallo-endopeptidase [Mycobacteroides abscessus]
MDDLLPADRCRARDILDSLRSQGLVPSPWSVESFVDGISEWRGREVRLAGLDSNYWQSGGSDLLTGLLVTLEHRDYVFYRLDVSARQQEHIILHEIGHLLLGHTNSQVLSGMTGNLFDQNLVPDSTSILRILQRTNLDVQEEREAEAFADAVMTSAALSRDHQTDRYNKILGTGI